MVTEKNHIVKICVAVDKEKGMKNPLKTSASENPWSECNYMTLKSLHNSSERLVLNKLWKDCKFHFLRIYNISFVRPIEEKCYVPFILIRIVINRNESNLFPILNPPKFFNFLYCFYFIGFCCIRIKPYSDLLHLFSLQISRLALFML